MDAPATSTMHWVSTEIPDVRRLGKPKGRQFASRSCLWNSQGLCDTFIYLYDFLAVIA